MQAKELNGFNPDFLKEPLETFPSNGQNKWESRNGLFNRKRLEIGMNDIQRQPFDCTSDEDVASSIPSEVNENSPIKRTCTKLKRRTSAALNDLMNKEKTHSKTVDSYKSKINHVLNLINSHSNISVAQDVHGLIMLPNFALVFLIVIFLISFFLKSINHIIHLLNLRLFNFICSKKHLPLTCLALIFYIFLMIVSAVISFLMNPVPRKIYELFVKT